jgi:two-component system NarL family sensor kinase
VVVLCGVICVAVGSSEVSDWQPLELVFVLGAFAIASDLLSVRIKGIAAADGGTTGWWFTVNAPYVLAAVFLGAAPAASIAAVSLLIVEIRSRTRWRDAVANYANYGAHLVALALIASWVIEEGDLAAGDVRVPLLVVTLYELGVVMSFFLNAAYGALAYGEVIRDAARNVWRLQLAAESPIVLATGLTAYIYGTTRVGALVVLVALQLIFISLARELRLSYERADALKSHAEELVVLHGDLANHATQISELSASRGRLVGQILSAEEGERRRLAESLHDDAMQNLLAARQDLESVVAPAYVARARAALDATIDQLREAIFELHPAVLERVGLAAAVEAVAERHARRVGFETRVNVDPSATSDRDVLVFTVCRELLANAAEHSGASHVAVVLRGHPRSIVLDVVDDGSGFERQGLKAAVERGHIGLASASERIEALGGTFEITSRIGHGTHVRATIPVSASDAGDSEARTREAETVVAVPMPAAAS